jgi:hypothetical protein
MTLRKLLQIEIWSKRTTRRIWFFLLVCIVVFFVWKLIDANWLTQKERVVARNALHRIEILNDANSSDVEALKREHQEVETAIQNAEAVAVTQRDKLISMDLTACSMGLESKWMDLIRQKLIQTERIKKSSADREERDKKLSIMLQSVSQNACLNLHKELD